MSFLVSSQFLSVDYLVGYSSSSYELLICWVLILRFFLFIFLDFLLFFTFVDGCSAWRRRRNAAINIRVSSMPDEILCRILSLVTTKEAVATRFIEALDSSMALFSQSESVTLNLTPVLSNLCTPFCSLEKPMVLISSTLSTYAFNTVILILLIILGFPILPNGSTLLLNAKEDATIFISVLMLTITITLMMIVTGNFPNCQHLFSHAQLLLLLTSTASLSKASLFLQLDLDFHHSKLFRCNALNSMNFEISCWY